jgi:predicted nucleotidyltransferase
MILKGGDKCILYPTRDPLFGYSRERLIEALRKKLKGRAEAVYIFGSFAENRVSPGSDLDLILVVKTDLPFLLRGRVYEDLRELIPSLDLLIYTPEEFRMLTDHPTVGFWESVTQTMIRIL